MVEISTMCAWVCLNYCVPEHRLIDVGWQRRKLHATQQETTTFSSQVTREFIINYKTASIKQVTHFHLNKNAGINKIIRRNTCLLPNQYQCKQNQDSVTCAITQKLCS